MKNRKKLCLIVVNKMVLKAFLLPHITKLQQDFDIDIIIPESEHDVDCPLKGIKWIYIGITRKISFSNDFFLLLRLMRVFFREKYDGVITIVPKVGMIGMFASLLLGVPVRIHCIVGQVWYTKKGLYRHFLKFCDMLTVLFATSCFVDSPSQLSFLIGEGFTSLRRKGFLCGRGSICGVERADHQLNRTSEDMKKLRNRLGIKEGEVVCLFLARITRDKGASVLSDAFKRILALEQSVRLIIVGPDEEKLVEIIRRELISFADRVDIYGYTEEPEMFYLAADIFCLPSLREGFGMVTISASSFGLPVVATRIYGSIDAVQDGITGLLVNPNDPDDFANSLIKLIKQPDLRKELGRNGIRYAQENFAREKIVDEFFVKICSFFI